MYEIEFRAEREQKCDREILLHEQLTAQDYLDISMAVGGNDPAKWDHKLHPKTGLPLEDNKKVFKQHWVNGLRDLFSLYINDISADIESEIRLFADDCVCYREIKNAEDTLKLQRDIDRLGSWARKWGMRFQPVKCNMMQLTNKRSSLVRYRLTIPLRALYWKTLKA